MKKAVIFYFSGTGNTWWVSEKVADYLGKHHIDAGAVSIEKISPAKANELVTNCDIVGFGYPIYGSDLPLPMKEFINKLLTVKGKPAFVFCTQWMYSGDGARTGRGFLVKKGFDIRWGEHFFMPNNICIPAFRFLPYTNNREKIEKRLHSTEQRISRFVNSILNDKKHRRGFNVFSGFMGNIQRVPFRMAMNSFRDLVTIDEGECINCGDCIKLCPVDNLVSDAGNEIKAKGECIFCLRCYNFCPVSAVMIMNKPHGNRKKPYRGPVENFDPAILSKER